MKRKDEKRKKMCVSVDVRVAGSKKIKRPSLAISSFKKGQRKAKLSLKICKK